jgi:hypothetical protein
MSGFADNALDLIKGLVILIVGIYLLSALIGILEIGKALVQMIQSFGFSIVLAIGLIILFIIFKEEI